MTDKDKLEKVKAEIERLIGDYNIKTEKYRGLNEQTHQYYGGKRDALSEILKSIGTMQKECIYSKDNYTDEDRKVLCGGCEEKCKFNKKEEPASEDLEEALAEEWQGYVDRGAATVDALEDNTQELAFAKGFYRGANWQKEQFEKDYTNLCNGIATAKGLAVAMAYDKGMADAKEQMLAKAVDATVHIDAGGYPYIPQMELYDYDKDIPLAKEGDKYKVILIKED